MLKKRSANAIAQYQSNVTNFQESDSAQSQDQHSVESRKRKKGLAHTSNIEQEQLSLLKSKQFVGDTGDEGSKTPQNILPVLAYYSSGSSTSSGLSPILKLKGQNNLLKNFLQDDDDDDHDYGGLISPARNHGNRDNVRRENQVSPENYHQSPPHDGNNGREDHSPENVDRSPLAENLQNNNQNNGAGHQGQDGIRGAHNDGNESHSNGFFIQYHFSI